MSDPRKPSAEVAIAGTPIAGSSRNRCPKNPGSARWASMAHRFHADDRHGRTRAVRRAQGTFARRADDRFDARRQQSREARRVANSNDTALRRVFRTYVAARAVLGLLLAMVRGGVAADHAQPLPLILLCLGYATQSVTLWLLPQLRPQVDAPVMTRLRRRQWLATIGFDVLAFAALHLFDPAANLNFARCCAAGADAGVMTTRLAAMGTAAVVALVLLSACSHHDEPVDGTLFTHRVGRYRRVHDALLAGEFSGRWCARRWLRAQLEIARQQRN